MATSPGARLLQWRALLLQNPNDLLFRKAAALHALVLVVGQNELQTGLSPRDKVSYTSNNVLTDIPKKRDTCNGSVPLWISHVATVCLRICNVPTQPFSRKAVFTDCSGLPSNSTKYARAIPNLFRRLIRARRRSGIGTGGCLLFVALLPCWSR